jgi:phenylacetaldehyde dehydrogenase
MATATDAPSAAARFLAHPKRMLIDGEWAQARHGRTLEVYDPATGEVIDHVPAGDAEDVELAALAARPALEDFDWSRMTASERGRVIRRIGELILEHPDEPAAIESLDNGKPMGVARAADVRLAADLFPIPWNFPLLTAARKLAPALATGCTVVLKHAEQTPLSALRLVELMQEAGLPDGVINVITGFGETACVAIAAHRGIDKVAFTGSTEVGKPIVKAAADDHKRVTLELGGQSPYIVFADADLDTAAPGAARAIFFNHGQCFCAWSRLHIESEAYDDVLAGVADRAEHIKVGRGSDDDTEMGPLVSAEQLERVTGYLESARRHDPAPRSLTREIFGAGIPSRRPCSMVPDEGTPSDPAAEGRNGVGHHRGDPRVHRDQVCAHRTVIPLRRPKDANGWFRTHPAASDRRPCSTIDKDSHKRESDR